MTLSADKGRDQKTGLTDKIMHLTVDLVILTIRTEDLSVLIITRRDPPFEGQAALPGGHMRRGEDVWRAAARELHEETGIDASLLHLEQLPVASEPDRDPRYRVVTVPFLAIAPNLPEPIAGTDATTAEWISVDAALSGQLKLAFDHDEILRSAVERARVQLEYTTLAAAFCPEEFTIGDLRAVYEAVWGQRVDPGNFHRKVTNTAGFVVPVGRPRPQRVGRPAALYRRGPATVLHPAMLRGTDLTTGGQSVEVLN